MTRRTIFSLAAAFALVTIGCGTTTVKGPGSATPATVDDGVKLGGAATDFTLMDVEGKAVRLSDFAGKVVLLDFWATWCVPCEAEMPHLEKLYREHRDEGLVILGIAMDGPETVAGVAPFVRRNQLTFPVLLDEETRVVGTYNPKRTAPLLVEIDRHGQIARLRQGYNPGDEQLVEADVKNLLMQK